MKLINKIKLGGAVLSLLVGCNQATSQSAQTKLSGANLNTSEEQNADGGQIGNGGDAVVCYKAADRKVITSVKMFDYWEQDAVLHYPGGIDLGGHTLSVQSKINKAVDRIAKFDPVVAVKIKTVALSLANNINDYLVTSAQLPEIDDANPKLIPNTPNCFIEQFAVQYPDLVTGQRRFAIAAKFYNHAATTNEDKAGLLLHEAIYRYAILNGAKDSDGVRFYNYVVATSKIDGLGVNQGEDYLNILNDAKMNYLGCKPENGLIVYKVTTPYEQTKVCYSYQAIPKPGYTALIPPEARVYIDGYGGARVWSEDHDIVITTVRNGVSITLKAKSMGFENIKDYPNSYSFFHMQFSKNNDPMVVNTHFKMSGPLNSNITCTGKEGKYLSLGPVNEVRGCAAVDGKLQIAGQVIQIEEGDIGKYLNSKNEWEYDVRAVGAPVVAVPGSQSGLKVTLNEKTEHWSGTQTFDQQGQLIKATAIGPIPINFGGKIFNIEHFYVKNGTLIWSDYIPVEAKTDTGALVLADIDDVYSHPQLAKICKAAGFSDSPGTRIDTTTKKIYVEAPQKMFSLKANTYVTKTDEDVEVFDMLGCQGSLSTTVY